MNANSAEKYMHSHIAVSHLLYHLEHQQLQYLAKWPHYGQSYPRKHPLAEALLPGSIHYHHDKHILNQRHLYPVQLQLQVLSHQLQVTNRIVDQAFHRLFY